MSGWLTLLPPIIIIGMVLLTRKVILSFLVGILSAIILLIIQTGEGISGFWNEGVLTFFNTLFNEDIFEKGFTQVIKEDGLIHIFNIWNISILYFLFALGILTSLMILSGSTRALSDYVLNKVKSKKAALYLTSLLGIFIFIDDYFNALVVGNVCKPIAKEYKITRAKLAYIVDSTAAPVCVIAFISSWGAGIISSMEEAITNNQQLSHINSTAAFFETIPFHFYVITALTLVFLTIRYNINLGPMKYYELDFENNQVDETINDIELKDSIDINHNGRLIFAIIPFAFLFIGTITALILTGFSTDTSLIIGGTLAIIGALIPVIYYVIKGSINSKYIGKGILHGLKSMLNANIILVLAWVIASLISKLGTAEVLSQLVLQSNIEANFIPLIVFILAAVMAFSTGTSWGAFGILIPLVGGTIAVLDPSLFIPVMAATLSGAVFGDHASPISDTTLLSSAGSGCEHGVHFRTQLPYVVVAASIAGLGYLTFGVTHLFLSSIISLLFAYVVIILSFIIFVYIKRQDY